MQNKNYPLRTILWETTLRCNANCIFCGSRCICQTSVDELKADEVISAFRNIAEKTDASQIMVNVTGGEPLVRSDTIEIMKAVHALGFPWGLVTNGMLLTEQIVSELKAAGMSTISISIDGMQETHDAIRGVRDGFERILEGLQFLQKENFVETVMITTVVSRKNIAELDELKSFLITQPIDVWRICPVDEIGRASDEGTMLLSEKELHHVLTFIKSLREENLPFTVTTSCSHYLGNHEFQLRDFPFRCQAGRTVCSILSNGDIFVCPNVERKPFLIQGNVKKDNLVDVWNNRFSYFRDDEKFHIGECSSCTSYDFCKGDSLHTWDFNLNRPKFCAKKLNLIESRRYIKILRKSRDAMIRELKSTYGTLRCLSVSPQSSAKDSIWIMPDVSEALFSYFQWGTQERTTKQICALYGSIFQDAEYDREVFLVVVQHISPILDIESTDTKLMMRKEFVDTASKKANDFSEKTHLLGFVHSHPNDLQIAMSLGDYHFHRYLFERDWGMALSIILNPQKKQIAAYAGPSANHVALKILFTNREEDP